MERGKEMVKRTVEELKAYEAPGHFGCTAMRIHGKEETGAAEFWIGVSTFLPGGGAEYAYEDNPLEKVYYYNSILISLHYYPENQGKRAPKARTRKPRNQITTNA